MKRFYDHKNLPLLLNEIEEKGFDKNYAAMLASDYFFDENPDVNFSEEFCSKYNQIMEFFQNAYTDVSQTEFGKVVKALKEVVLKDQTTKEDIFCVINSVKLKEIRNLFHEGRISKSVVKRKLRSLNADQYDLEFIFDKVISKTAC